MKYGLLVLPSCPWVKIVKQKLKKNDALVFWKPHSSKFKREERGEAGEIPKEDTKDDVFRANHTLNWRKRWAPCQTHMVQTWFQVESVKSWAREHWEKGLPRESPRKLTLTSLLILLLVTRPHCPGLGKPHLWSWLAWTGRLCDFDKPPATRAPFSPWTTWRWWPDGLAGAFQP